MRLNFVSPPVAQIEDGVARLARAIGQEPLRKSLSI